MNMINLKKNDIKIKILIKDNDGNKEFIKLYKRTI
jgi:hypothetical protein